MFASTLSMMYVARTLDSFISIRALVIKSILSKFVNADELGRTFSIIAIIEAIGKFVFVALYSVVYENTLETWPAAFYFVTFIFLAITAILFWYGLHFLCCTFHSCGRLILIFDSFNLPFQYTVFRMEAENQVWRTHQGTNRCNFESRSRRNNAHVNTQTDVHLCRIAILLSRNIFTFYLSLSITLCNVSICLP